MKKKRQKGRSRLPRTSDKNHPRPDRHRGLTGKKISIFAKDVEKEALDQFYSAMGNDFSVTGVMLPDAHTGYTLPIGAVVGTTRIVLPSWVGYDIGCGMCAVATGLQAEHLLPFVDSIYRQIYDRVPTGFNHHSHANNWDHSNLEKSDILQQIFRKKGLLQLGTLGSGNHFIEIGFDEAHQIWLIVHSGSRGTGHAVATHYMKQASGDCKAREGHYGFDVDSKNGRSYIIDMDFCLAYALENRKRMIAVILDIIEQTLPGQPLAALDPSSLINRTHNHVEHRHGMWIHRKGATQAEDGMRGVIPGNMRDGSFIVEGLGNRDSLWSSSHGAGRVLGRRKARQQLSLEQFRKSMAGIKAKVTTGTLDESPFAYKDIFQIMDSQAKMVKILHHVRPIINIKA